MRPIHRNVIIGMAALALSGLACGAATPRPVPAPPSPTAAVAPAIPTTSELPARLIVGVEYAYPQAAVTFGDSGATSAKPYPDLSAWGHVQSGPDQPYNWKLTDDFVRAFQGEGFRHLTLMPRAAADWAAKDPPVKLLRRGDNFPKPEYEAAYVAYGRAMVERYDMDGVDDMPGLLAPVTLFGFEPEYSTYWPGDAASYVRLLELAYPAVKAANPNALVMTAGLLMTGVFQGYPTADEINRRLAKPDPRIFDKTAADVSLLLDHPEVFDVVDFHALGHYSESPATVEWLRAQMASRGYQKPIWIGDSLGGAALNGWGPAACPAGPRAGFLEYPATESDRCAVASTLEALRDEKDPGHAQAVAWLRAEAAAGVVRKVVLSAGEHLAGINIGNVEDWEALALAQGGAGTSPWQGMIDRDMLTKVFHGYRPAYFALQQVTGLIRVYTDVTRLDAGDPHIYLFRFHMDSEQDVIVAWADTGLWLPSRPMPTREWRIPISGKDPVRVTWTVTEGSQPREDIVTPQEGSLALDLGPLPAFLWLP
ncbi:MAG: hypothetical protein M1337_00410 [Actinobacteria bacterium]|nr:hypothetical protein [Actinomycetota bacterium]